MHCSSVLTFVFASLALSYRARIYCIGLRPHIALWPCIGLRPRIYCIGFRSSIGLWPRIYCIGLRARFWVLALHRASASHRVSAPLLSFGPASGFGPLIYCIRLRARFWVLAPHRASAPLLSFGPVSGLSPAFTAFGPWPSIYCFWAPAQHLLHSSFDTSHLLLSGSSEFQNRLGFKFIQAILRGASLILSLQRLEVTAPQAEHDPTLDCRRYQHDHASDQRMDLIYICCGRRLNTGGNMRSLL
ncbi:hypothetical protein CRG98_047729 [Punica granatum]|uniref:Secreted protein n=1 Tax=Punica granatum TaxID=22663 RepID=A0A2I0HK79_PUNGR|nr:hypothetical protein CRG98_047729 [Punica granatum]